MKSGIELESEVQPVNKSIIISINTNKIEHLIKNAIAFRCTMYIYNVEYMHIFSCIVFVINW